MHVKRTDLDDHASLHLPYYRVEQVTVKSKAYGATTDANYVPVQGSLSLIASGEIVSGSGAFCTAQKQYAIARYNGQVYEFVTNGGTFSSVGGSGLPVWGRINGAAVSPVCGV